MKNWIKLYRKITDWEYYGDNEAVKLFLHILLCADYKTGCYRTTLRQLSAETGVSFQRVRTLLCNFTATGEIQMQTKQGHKGKTTLIINNFEKYQSRKTQTLTQKLTQTLTQTETAPTKGKPQVSNTNINTETNTETNTLLHININNKEDIKENKKENNITTTTPPEAEIDFFEKIKIEELEKMLRPIYCEETQTATAIRQMILHEQNRLLEISELAKYFDEFVRKTLAEGTAEMTRKEYQHNFLYYVCRRVEHETQQKKKPNSRKPDPHDRLKVTKPQNNGGGYWDR